MADKPAYASPSKITNPNDIQSVLDGYKTVQNSLSDPNLDALTRGDLAKGFASVAATKGTWGTNDPVPTLNNLLSTIDQARQGIGMYGVRKINENQKSILASQPGRMQLTAQRLGAARQNSQNQQQGSGSDLGANTSPLGSFF